MKSILRTCAMESRVVRAVRAGTWPQSAEPTLAEHVAGCRACGEIARVGAALHAVARVTPPAVSAGALWWRAQLRRRYHALESVARPLVWGHAAAFVLLLAVLAGALTRAILQARAPSLMWTRAAAALTSLSGPVLWVACATGGILLAGLAAAFATRGD